MWLTFVLLHFLSLSRMSKFTNELVEYASGSPTIVLFSGYLLLIRQLHGNEVDHVATSFQANANNLVLCFELWSHTRYLLFICHLFTILFAFARSFPYHPIITFIKTFSEKNCIPCVRNIVKYCCTY